MKKKVKKQKYYYETVPVYLLTLPIPYLKRCFCCWKIEGIGFVKRSFIQIGTKRVRVSELYTLLKKEYNSKDITINGKHFPYI